MLKVRPHSERDIELRVKWLNNPKVNRYVGEEIGKKTTLKKQKEWFADYKKDPNKKFFTILFDKIPVGFMGFSNISQVNKNADLFIMIGEDGYRGKGLGEQAMNWLIDYGFQKLKLHKINLGVIKDNKPAVSLYKKLGFAVEGEMKDEVFHDGKYYNFLSMALFK